MKKKSEKILNFTKKNVFFPNNTAILLYKPESSIIGIFFFSPI